MGESFGEALRTARESAGLEIRDLAETTRIQARYLEALETEDWAVLPSGAIGRGFVRVVARELGVAPGPLVELYRTARGQEDAAPERQLPETDWKVEVRGARRGPGLSLVVVAVAAVGVALWVWRTWQPRLHPASPAREASSVRPQAPSAPPPVTAAEAPSTREAPLPASAPALAPSEGEAAAPQPVEAQQGADAGDVAAGTEAMRIEIQATGQVWVRVTPEGGKSRSRLLEPGEKIVAEDARGIDVRLGNAAAARLFWNGEELRPAGTRSQVVDLHFPQDAERLKR